MTPEGIRSIIDSDDGQHIEFIESFDMAKEAVVNLCAFAMTEGGILLFGVRNNGTVCGIELGQDTIEKFVTRLEKMSEPPLSVNIHQPTKIEGMTVVAVEVGPIAPDKLVAADGRYFVRIGRVNQQMSTAEIEARVMSGLRVGSDV
jgi:ATP-dependent DNA helicase RecG